MECYSKKYIGTCFNYSSSAQGEVDFENQTRDVLDLGRSQILALLH